MKLIFGILVLWCFIFAAGCSAYGPADGASPTDGAVDDLKDAGDTTDPVDPGPGENVPSQPLEETLEVELTRYVSEDGRVAITVEDFMIADTFPEQASAFLSGDPDQGKEDREAENAKNLYFESSQFHLLNEGAFFLALFITVDSIEEEFIKKTQGFQEDPPVLICREGASYERTIAQFRYTGSPADYAGPGTLPQGSKGLIVFALPIGEIPLEVHYNYVIQNKEDAAIEKGKIVVPFKILNNN